MPQKKWKLPLRETHSRNAKDIATAEIVIRIDFVIFARIYSLHEFIQLLNLIHSTLANCNDQIHYSTCLYFFFECTAIVHAKDF